MEVRAIIWDFDGTLVDSWRRNLAVCRRIVREVTGRDGNRFRALLSLENFYRANRQAANWREMYQKEFGFDEELTDLAGSLWTRYQMEEKTPACCYPGVAQVVRRLRNVPQGVVSQNSRSLIRQTLQVNGLGSSFGSVIGYEQVGMRRQKPAPDGLLMCIEDLTGERTGRVFYIGDHEGDMQCVEHARKALREQGVAMEVLGLAACYAPHVSVEEWKSRPAHLLTRPEDLVGLVERQ